MTKFFTIFFLVLSFKGFTQCNPVASFPFNGNTNDVSGNGNNGILGGTTVPVLAADRFGNANSAYQFGGYYNQNWIQIPNSSSLTFGNAMSVSLWFKQCSFAGMDGWGNYSANGHFILISKSGDGISANPGIWCWTYPNANNTLDIAFNNKNGSINFVQDTTFDCFDTCEWVHCVVVINNTTWQMYLNGQLRKQATIAPADFTVANTQDFYLGRMFGGGIIWYPFNGIIDDVNIYNCALTQGDVNTLYANYVDPFSSNNNITVDSISISNPCSTSNSASINIFPNPNNSPYQYSLNSGAFQSSNSFTNLSQGTYNIIIKSSCTTKDTTITIGSPSVTTNIVASICHGNSYQLPSGNFVNSSGIYHDTIFASVGCDSVFNTTLTVNWVTTNIVASICQGNNYQLPNGNFVNSSGIYHDTIFASVGCDSIFNTTLTVNQVYSFSVSDTICYGEIYHLPNDTTVTSAGTYTSNLQTTHGCDSTIVTTLFLFPQLSDTFIVQDASCHGNNDGAIHLFSFGGLAPFSFQLAGVGTNSNGTFNNLSAGNYTFTITDNNGCTVTGNCIVNQPNKIEITVHPNDTTINANDVVSLVASCNYPNASFIWSPITFLSCDTCSNTTSTPDINVTYHLTVTVSPNGVTCSEDTTIIIRIKPNIFAPNAFTPNDDGLNDFFQVVGNNFENISDFDIEIYNRWGQRIFQSNNIHCKWDGTFNDQKEQIGVYVYVIKYNVIGTNDSEQVKTGNITILR